MTEKLRPFLLAAVCLALAGLVWLDNRPDPEPAAPSAAATAPAETHTDMASDTETSADTNTEAEPDATAAALAKDDAAQESGGDTDAVDVPVVETDTAVPADEKDNVEPHPANATAEAASEGGAAEEVPVEGGAPAGRDDDDSVANPLSSFTLGTFDQTVQRPLFAPARKRPPPAEAGASEAPAKMDHAYDLLGVALGGNRPIAIMRKKLDGKSFRVEVGDMLGGWHVSKVDSQSVELERAGGEQEIVPLFRE